jgi:two-component system phosphate regulon sensor histidine kinase PhoR
MLEFVGYPLMYFRLRSVPLGETKGPTKSVERSDIFGAPRIAERPIIWSITSKTEPHRSSEFEALLLAIAGHDLRQPLQIIQGACEILGRGIRTEPELRLLRSSQCAVDQLRDKLDQLLTAIRLRNDIEGEVRLTPIPIEPLLRQACRENQISALKKGISVRTVSTTATVRSNALLISAVLDNLVNNAIKYTRPGGRILVGCRHVGESIRIDVQDTGIGITAEQMPRIFEAFTRLDSTRHDGLGVGLFIVRQAIGLLGHRLDINSVPSLGTRFSIFATKAEQTAAKPCPAVLSQQSIARAQP